MNEINKKLIKIINEVIEGRMKLKEFYQLLPDEADEGTLYEDIVNDIETVIEHRPYSYNFYNKNNYIKKKTDYKILLLDLELLKGNYDIEFLLKIRSYIIQQGINVENLTDQISETISSYKTNL